jgi:uncharacterized protein YbjT (DUF2867 family)
MAPIKTIIFGATGRVGSAAARSARQHGADVILAMRDPQKPIPSLSIDQEREGGYERVEADLTKPDTIEAAVKKTSAKRAFIYVAFGTPDNMKSSITALKSAGIEFVVLLSSFSVQGDIRAIEPSDFVAWAHAQIEISLNEVFGSAAFVALRPAWFASNAMWYKKQIPEGEVKLAYPDPEWDWISPSDIGALAGALLVQGSQGLHETNEANVIYLNGPEKLSQKDAIGIIAQAIGRNIKVTRVDEQEGLEVFVKTTGLPEPVAKQLIQQQKAQEELKGAALFGSPHYQMAVGNIEKYLGKQPMRFEQWAEENKEEFGA